MQLQVQHVLLGAVIRHSSDSCSAGSEQRSCQQHRLAMVTFYHERAVAACMMLLACQTLHFVISDLSCLLCCKIDCCRCDLSIYFGVAAVPNCRHSIWADLL